MTEEQIQYVSKQRLEELQAEFDNLKNKKIPDIANRIDEAKQHGDLSENAEYQQAKEEMAWAHGRRQELEYILNNVQVLNAQHTKQSTVIIGSTILVKSGKKTKKYTIVGPQEANPLEGKISNESPLGGAFLGHKVGEQVLAHTPAGQQEFEILEIQ